VELGLAVAATEDELAGAATEDEPLPCHLNMSIILRGDTCGMFSSICGAAGIAFKSFRCALTALGARCVVPFFTFPPVSCAFIGEAAFSADSCALASSCCRFASPLVRGSRFAGGPAWCEAELDGRFNSFPAGVFTAGVRARGRGFGAGNAAGTCPSPCETALPLALLVRGRRCPSSCETANPSGASASTDAVFLRLRIASVVAALGAYEVNGRPAKFAVPKWLRIDDDNDDSCTD